MLARAQHGFRDRKPVAFLLDRLDGGTGRDAAENGQIAGVIGDRHDRRVARIDQLRLKGRAAFGRRRGRRLLRQLHYFQSPSPVGKATQEAAFLQRCDQAVNAGLGRQVQRLLHLVERRRDAGFLDPLMNEHEKFVLLTGEHG